MHGDTVVIKVVLVEGSVGDWAAYAGPGHWTDQEVREKGNKLGEAAARQVAYLGGQDAWTTKPYRD